MVVVEDCEVCVIVDEYVVLCVDVIWCCWFECDDVEWGWDW